MENKQQINDTVHIPIGYAAEGTDGAMSYFSSFDAVKMFVRETGIKQFFAYDKTDKKNIVKIKAIYMDRYRESDIEDRLIANKQQGGESFFVKQYKDERNQNENGQEL